MTEERCRCQGQGCCCRSDRFSVWLLSEGNLRVWQKSSRPGLLPQDRPLSVQRLVGDLPGYHAPDLHIPQARILSASQKRSPHPGKCLWQAELLSDEKNPRRGCIRPHMTEGLCRSPLRQGEQEVPGGTEQRSHLKGPNSMHSDCQVELLSWQNWA